MTGNAQILVSYAHGLIALSILAAIFSSYAAFDVAERMMTARGPVRWIWWMGGAATLAFGIWSTHYTGMLALGLPLPPIYEWPTSVLSFLPAFAGSAVAFYLLSDFNPNIYRICSAAIASGSGIAGVHYIAMNSLRLPVVHKYDWPVVVLSVSMAIVGAGTALTLVFHAAGNKVIWRKMLGAWVMGVAAISGMHYIAIAAVKFVPSPTPAVSTSFRGILGIVIVTLLIQALPILTSIGDRRLQTQREISTRILQSQEEERKRIAQQLHETVAQTLAALKMSLGKVRRTATVQNSDAIAAIEESILLADESMREIRTASYLLQPPLLEKDGLESTLRWYLSGFQERSGITVKLEAPKELDRLDPETESTVFRIVQECLTNIHRHSSSSTATIRLVPYGETLVLEVEDAGRGMPVDISANNVNCFPRIGVGIAAMQERAKKLGGNMTISSTGHGTRVTVTLPFASRA